MGRGRPRGRRSPAGSRTHRRCSTSASTSRLRTRSIRPTSLPTGASQRTGGASEPESMIGTASAAAAGPSAASFTYSSAVGLLCAMQASPGNALNRCPLRLRPNCYLRRIAQTKCTVTAGRAAAESVIHATPLNPQRGSPMARMGQGTCPHCGISLNFRQSSANSLVRCKGCGTKIHIPGLTHECFSSPPGPPATAMPGVDVTCLLGPLERRGVVGRVHLNTGFCACCRKKHVKQWYRHTKTGNAFYVCALTRMASIYQGGSERVATTLLGLADQVLGAGGPSAAPAGPNSTKEGLSRSVRKALEDFNLLSPQAQL